MSLEHLEKSDTLRKELDALLASDMFARAPLMQRLLIYLIDRKLIGHGRPPKAYQIATEALGRSADFDPAMDSYPRVMIGRLRNMLDRYYVDTAWVNRLRIPLGSYEIDLVKRQTDAGSDGPFASATPGSPVENFSTTPLPQDGGVVSPPDNIPHPAAAPAYPLTARLLILALAVALLALVGWVVSQQASVGDNAAPIAAPLLEVAPPQSGTTGEGQALGRGIEAKLRDGLRRFDGIRLKSAGAEGATNPLPKADFRLDTSVMRSATGTVEITFVLNRTADQRAIWSQQVSISNADMPSFAAIEPAVAQLAGDYGVIAHDQLRREPDNFSPGYPCLVQYNAVRNSRDLEIERRVVKCLRASLAREPTNPAYLNALSFTQLGVWRRHTDPAAKRAAFMEAQSFAQRAYDNSALTSAGIFALARVRFFAGQCVEGDQIGRAAVAINPYDADMIGSFGVFAASCGRAEAGEARLRRSIALDSSHSATPAVTLAFVLAERGENEEAQAMLDMVPAYTNGEPQFMLVRAIVLANRSDMVQARRYWRQLLSFTRLPPGTPPETVLGKFLISGPVIDRAAKAVKRLAIAPPPSA